MHHEKLDRGSTANVPSTRPRAPTHEAGERAGDELASGRTADRATIELLEESNARLRLAEEEAATANEELRATNEELQATAEELRATNEELTAANAELLDGSREIRRMNDDLLNVLGGVRIAILLLDVDSRIRRFTPEAARLLNLLADDVGRPLADIKSNLQATDLPELVRDVLAHLAPRELTTTDESGRWYKLTVRPYVTTARKIDGCVVSFLDVDATHRSHALLTDALDYAECIVDSVDDALAVLDANERIVSANRAFCAMFRVAGRAAGGKRFDELAGASSTGPALRAALDRLAAGETVDAVVLPLEIPPLDARTLVLSARPIIGQADRPRRCLLAFHDVTEQARTNARLRRYKERLRQMAFDTAIAAEKERRRIASGLHDVVGQALALAQLRLSAARVNAGQRARADLDEGARLLDQAMKDTRSFTFELSPPILYDLGLAAALGWLGEQLEAKHHFHVAVESDDATPRLDDATSGLLFRGVRELLTNVIKHANTEMVSVVLRGEGKNLSVCVEDHGTGFDLRALREHDATGGFGLFSVREQITQLGGSVDITSRIAHGTKITLRVPVERCDAPDSEIRPERQV